MKLDTAIRETILRDAEVVAGSQTLDREITWVHMVDHPDIAQWVKPGELLLTTGYNWPSDEVSSRNLVRNLNKVGLAGVVLAVPHFREHFPPEALEEANRVGLPLLELPWDVPFSEVTHEILAKIINFQGNIIERSEKLHRALTNAAVSATSLSDIAAALTSLLGRFVTFTDPAGGILGGSDSVEALTVLEPQFVAAVQGGSLPADFTVMQRPFVVVFATEAALLHRIVFPVRLHDTVVALIWLDLAGNETQELDARAIEHASMVAALHMMHQRQLAQQEDRLGYALVAGLLDGEFSASAGALERARVCGWSDSKAYRVCLVLLDEPIPLTTEGLERRERWVESLKRQLRARKLPELIAIWLNQIKFIVPEDASTTSLWEALSDKRSAMAISRIHTGVKGMAVGAQDVDALVPTLRPGRLHQFDEILFPRALMGDPNARDLLIERLIGPLSEKRRGESLLETLCNLADEGFQLANTAKALGIHISTLRYRVERIESTLKLSLEDPKVRFQLQVAVALYRLRED
ncbi:PucR family transcriptional regulator [Caballeronia sordidicola]|jgi:purine catabolism regulator|uniref:Cys-tRNA(Pro) deacylase YbaK n=1 Tax=Caballeronia sordidicola TaxID=196367 RepID=A0A226WTM0_CABSO|nr:PucR family transcriptional regulator [Caballeronia sordidicola]OXC74521.1 Cys-tRNA(Pro) deacylase YbaK [Caballeronia sordidicola]